MVRAELLQSKFCLHELKGFGVHIFTANYLSSLKIIYQKVFNKHLFSFGIFFNTGDTSSIFLEFLLNRLQYPGIAINMKGWISLLTSKIFKGPKHSRDCKGQIRTEWEKKRKMTHVQNSC